MTPAKSDVMGYSDTCAPMNMGSSLRRHYPDQLKRVHATCVSQPRKWSTPVDVGQTMTIAAAAVNAVRHTAATLSHQPAAGAVWWIRRGGWGA